MYNFTALKMEFETPKNNLKSISQTLNQKIYSKELLSEMTGLCLNIKDSLDYPSWYFKPLNGAIYMVIPSMCIYQKIEIHVHKFAVVFTGDANAHGGIYESSKKAENVAISLNKKLDTINQGEEYTGFFTVVDISWDESQEFQSLVEELKPDEIHMSLHWDRISLS